MQITIASIAVIVVSAIGVASAQGSANISYGICTCFKPKYDASCCIPAQGYQMNDGNVCETIDFGDSVEQFKACCARSGGHDKCKIGYRYPDQWPPEDSYGCKA